MKKLKQLWFDLWDNKENPKTDQVQKIMSIIQSGNSITSQISIKLEIDVLFDEKMINKRNLNKIENDAIDTFFASNITVNL